jgi:hypothetical protein
MGLVFMSSESYQVKQATLQQIAGNSPIVFIGNAKACIGSRVVHLRYCSENRAAPGKYKFNINPNTLSADFELWICGVPQHFYLMPISIMRGFYWHPEAYIDNHHPNIRIVSVDAERHRATYARVAISADLSQYFRASLA